LLIVIKGVTSLQTIYVIHPDGRALLGRPASEALNIIGTIRKVNSADATKYRNLFSSLFGKLDRLEGEYSIRLQNDAVLFQVAVPRRVALSQFSKVKAELDQMHQDGVIAEVEQPTGCCDGMVVVPKRNSKIRICLDYTKLNTWVKREKHPLPHVNQVHGQLSGPQYFSKFDAKSGFWEMKLPRNSCLLTRLITPMGHFCCNQGRGVGIVRSRRFWVESESHSYQHWESESNFFVGLRLRMSKLDQFYITHLN